MTLRPSRVGGAAWVLSTVLLAAVEIVVPQAWTLPWNPADRAISDLGAVTCGLVDYAHGAREVCSPWHALANVGWVAAGLLLAIGAVLVRRRLLSGRWGVATAVLLVITGLSTAATGLAPLDTRPDLHLLVAAPAFLTSAAALVAAQRALRREASSGLRRAALVGAPLSAAGMVGVLLWPVVGGPLGLVERLAVYPVQVWALVAGWTLLRGRPR